MIFIPEGLREAQETLLDTFTSMMMRVLNKVLSDSGKRLNDGVSYHPLWVTVEKEATKD